MKMPKPISLPCILAAICAIGPLGRAGTITIEGDQIVTGNQTVNSNQVVRGSLTVSNEASALGLGVVGPAHIAGSRLRSFGSTETNRWIRVAQLGGGAATNALFSGRVLAEGNGADYVADFAFPAAPPSGPYSALLVEMGAASNLAWEVWADGGAANLWFFQPAGSRFATFLYRQHGCVEDWAGGNRTGTNVWSSTTGDRGGIRVGAVTLSGAGLRLPDGTLLDARSNMTASALVDGSNTLLSASGGRLAFGAPADFSGEVNLPGIVALGTGGVTLSAARWDMVDSSFTDGSAWSRSLAATIASAIRGMVQDGAGNRYVYGAFAGNINLGPGANLTSGTGSAEGDLAGFAVKFDGAGKLLWARAFPVVNYAPNSVSGESLVDITDAGIDAAGNLYLCGTLRAQASFGGITRTPNGPSDGFVASLDGSGGLRWFQGLGAEGHETLADMEVAPSGSSIAVGGRQASLYEQEGYGSHWDGNGYAARLNGSGTVTASWSLQGDPAGNWTWTESESFETGFFETWVSHVCLCGDGVLVRWTKVTEGEWPESPVLRRLGGTEWHIGGPVYVTSMASDASGNAFVIEPQIALDEEITNISKITKYSASDGSNLWSRAGRYVWDDVNLRVAEASDLREVKPEAGGGALLVWGDGWATELGGSAENESRVVVERVEAAGNTAWSNALSGVLPFVYQDGGQTFTALLERAYGPALSMDGASNLHAYGIFEGDMDLGAAGSLSGGGGFHARFAGTSNIIESLKAAPVSAGALVEFCASGQSLALACSGPPPAYIHSDPQAASIALGGYLDLGLGLRLPDGTAISSIGDLASLSPWMSGSSSGSYWIAGNVGLGVSSPAARLDVDGDARFTGGLTADGAISGGSLSVTGGVTVGGAVGVGSGLSVGSGEITLGVAGPVLSAGRWATVDSSFRPGIQTLSFVASGGSSVTGMVTDTAGNRYVFGSFSGTMDLGGGTVLSSASTQNDRGGFVAKLDDLGGLTWAKAFPLVNHTPNGQQNEMLVEIAKGAIDGSGNLVLCGTFRARANFAGITDQPEGGGDGFIISLRPDGTAAWFQKFGGAEAAPDTLVDIDVGPGGTNIVAGGTLVQSGDTDGLVVAITTTNGGILAQSQWTLAGDPADPQGSDIGGSVAHVCLSGASPVAAWEGGGNHCITNLGTTGWGLTNAGPVHGMLADGSGDVIALETDEVETTYGQTVGRATKMSGATGAVLWERWGSYSETWDEYQTLILNWERKQYVGVAVDRSDNVWLARNTFWYWYDPQYSTYDEGSYRGVDRARSSDGQVTVSVSCTAETMWADGAGDVHVVGYETGGLRHLRFDGATGATDENEIISGPSGPIAGLAASVQSLAVACAGPPPALVLSAPWDVTLAVDGYLSVGGGVRLADGTYLASGADIASLGPVQFGADGSAYFGTGNFGIGTDSPGYRLDVVGGARITGPVTIGSSLTVSNSLNVVGDVTNRNLVVLGNLSVEGTNSLKCVLPGGDISMGAFTNGPAH